MQDSTVVSISGGTVKVTVDVTGKVIVESAALAPGIVGFVMQATTSALRESSLTARALFSNPHLLYLIHLEETTFSDCVAPSLYGSTVKVSLDVTIRRRVELMGISSQLDPTFAAARHAAITVLERAEMGAASSDDVSLLMESLPRLYQIDPRDRSIDELPIKRTGLSDIDKTTPPQYENEIESKEIYPGKDWERYVD